MHRKGGVQVFYSQLAQNRRYIWSTWAWVVESNLMHLCAVWLLDSYLCPSITCVGWTIWVSKWSREKNSLNIYTYGYIFKHHFSYDTFLKSQERKAKQIIKTYHAIILSEYIWQYFGYYEGQKSLRYIRGEGWLIV